MLQVKNLRKEYVTNKSVVTTALDGVTLNFPETGMVFILGKSGSGKSTLLNLCGGLDKPSSGEIILNGKSCKDFKEKDFDLYRNTFAGFVFQEYNIVEEYTVEENVALALELQGKRNKQEVAKILEEADLFDLAARKANTLSGGQKQRVAIARALVKQPQIILADEPTGALDSQTGTQIFDLLKKYSENRLVLVVSHDRDFAERYADRIIELQDGKVLSDDVRLPNGSFGELDAQPDPPLKEQSAAFLRARLPFRHALRMGFGYLKSKPVRLAFSIILCVFAFVLFGLSSTLMFYSENSVMAETIRLDQGNYVNLVKMFNVREKVWRADGTFYREQMLTPVTTKFTLNEYEELKKKYPDALAAVNSSNKPHNFSWDKDLWDYYGSNWANYVIADPSLKVLAGRLPTAEDEIALPEFLFQVMKLEQSKFVLVTEEDLAAGKLVNEDAPKHPVNTYGDVLYSESNPATIFVNIGEIDFNFKIVGIYKNDAEPKAYRGLKKAVESGDNGGSDYPYKEKAWYSLRNSGFYKYYVLSQDFFSKYNSFWNQEPFVPHHPSESDHFYSELDIKYKYTPDSVIGNIILKHNRSSIKLNRIVGLTDKEFADDTFYKLDKEVVDELDRVHGTVATFRNAFLYAGLGLALFAFLLMFNLISVSVITKKKEVGILRALGARSVDVFCIFFVEALFIAIISAAGAMILSLILCHILNLMMIQTIKAAIFIFGILSALFVTAVALFTAFFATLIPVANYTKKAPVESIRSA